MKSKLHKQLDKAYYIQEKQLGPEYEHFYELKKKGWLWDSVVVWGDLDKIEDYYKELLVRQKHYEDM